MRPQPVWSHCEISADITSWAQSNQCYEASEGALYVPHGAGARVLPGERFQYRWFADTGSGPLLGAASSVVWIYHPHDDEPAETNAGLLGAIIVTAVGKAKPDGTPRDVDREFVALFMIFDELQGRPEGLFCPAGCNSSRGASSESARYASSEVVTSFVFTAIVAGAWAKAQRRTAVVLHEDMAKSSGAGAAVRFGNSHCIKGLFSWRDPSWQRPPAMIATPLDTVR